MTRVYMPVWPEDSGIPVHHYEINVAMKRSDGRYHHLFATAPRSLNTREDAQVAINLIVAAFPAPKYHVSIRAEISYGVQLDVREIT